MFKIGICDDEKFFRAMLKSEILNLYAGQDALCFYEYESGNQLLNSDMAEVDLLFLDIQMSGVDGNIASHEFRKVNQKAILIFCTNYHVPTVENIKAQPFRYIVKDLQNK
ncbi:response regulator, partial [Mediterraneibacter glycyrrhizinilyticus]